MDYKEDALVEYILELNEAFLCNDYEKQKQLLNVDREWLEDLTAQAMNSNDIKMMASVDAILHYADKGLLKLSLSFGLIYAFYKKYYERCLIEDHQYDPEGPYHRYHILRRYETLYGAVKALIYRLDKLEASGSQEGYLEDLKQWMMDMYKKSNDDIKLAFETALFEHVLFDKRISHHFESWKNDPVMKKMWDFLEKTGVPEC